VPSETAIRDTIPSRRPPESLKAPRRAYAAWVTVCLVWGTTYLAIRIALESIPPLLMAGFRWVAAGAALLAALRLRGERLPPLRTWGTLVVLGILLLGFGNGGVVWAEQTVPSGLTAVLVAASPFWMVGAEALMPDGERLTVVRFAGLLVGFGGIVALVWPSLAPGPAGHAFLVGVASTQIACLGWALGSTYAKRHARASNVLTAAACQMLTGGLFLMGAASLRREWLALAFTPRTAGALAYLIVFGAVAGFSAYAYALKHLPVTTVSLYAYVNPVIAVVLGTLLLDEPFAPRTALAATVVLVGVALVGRR
jgi:drug/metabolite transporter (DMT)-like permease